MVNAYFGDGAIRWHSYTSQCQLLGWRTMFKTSLLCQELKHGHVNQIIRVIIVN